MGRFALLVLFAAVVLPSVVARDYWNPDEGRYGAVAREMWKGDGLLVPRLNGEVYGEKPPLYFWTVAACQAAAGSVAAPVSRIPSALATLATAFLLLALVRRSHGEREGLAAAAAYLASVLVLQMAGWVGIDAFVTLLVTAVVYTQARNDTGSRFGWTALGYALLAAIVLAKGAPIAIALLALAGYAVLARGPRGLVPRHLLWGAPLLLALLALWAVPAATSLRGGPGYLEGLTLGQAGKRIVGEDISHEQPLWYYVATFPGQFLPFTLLLPAAAVTAVRDLRAGGRPRRETGRYVLWFALPFLLFTLIPGKRERYLLPIYPAAAALVGIAVVRLAGTARFRALVRAPVAAALAVLGLAGLAVAALPLTFDGLVGPRLAMLDSLTLAEVSGAIRAWVSVLMVGGISTAIVASEGLLRRRDAAPLAPLVATVAVLVFTLGAGLLPALDRVKSYGRLAKPVARMAGPDARFALVGLQPGPFLLALDRHDLDRFDGSGRGRRALERMLTEPNTVVFATTDDFESMRRKAEFPLSVLSTRRVGRREIVAFRRE